MKVNKINQRQLMLNAFYVFFLQSGQSPKDINQNFADIQAMSINRLINIYNAFFN